MRINEFLDGFIKILEEFESKNSISVNHQINDMRSKASRGGCASPSPDSSAAKNLDVPHNEKR